MEGIELTQCEFMFCVQEVGNVVVFVNSFLDIFKICLYIKVERIIYSKNIRFAVLIKFYC